MTPPPFESYVSHFTLGSIHRFQTGKITSNIPHYFVVTGTCSTTNRIIFYCFTSKFEKRRKFLEVRNLDFCTLVPIPPDSSNNVPHDDNCVDCNSPVPHSHDELKMIYNSTGITPIGRVSDSHLQQLYIGAHASDLVEGWVKTIVPKDLD